MSNQAKTAVVVGLGYVGLPLAVALAKTVPTWGLDIDRNRIEELQAGHDRTGEIDSGRLNTSEIFLTADATQCPPADFYIVTVPTPVDPNNRPDLSIVIAATRSVADMIDPARKPIVIYESTVYPGVTEDICGPELERVSGLTCGKDFFLAYSPERINPGDHEHTIDRITKVVSGQTPEVLDQVAGLYQRVTNRGVFRAVSIKAAEAAKVIENAQRDINVAFVNEITRIFATMNLSVWDVLAAARTKWNFLNFEPGLVGGHCIGVDPYYLAHRATELGSDPVMLLAGRATNDGMADWIVDRLHAKRQGRPGTVLVLGLAFKPDVPDLRNSKVANMVRGFERLGHVITVHDPLVDAQEARREYGIDIDEHAFERQYDVVVLAVPHGSYVTDRLDDIVNAVGPGGLLADLKNVYGERSPLAIDSWTL